MMAIQHPAPIGDDTKVTFITGMLFAGTVVFISASAFAVCYANKKTKSEEKAIDKASTSSDCGSTKGDYAYDDETLERIEETPDCDSSSCASYDYSVQHEGVYAVSYCGSSSIDDDSATLGELGEICDKVGSILDDLDATSIITDAIHAETPMISNSKKSFSQSYSSEGIMDVH